MAISEAEVNAMVAQMQLEEAQAASASQQAPLGGQDTSQPTAGRSASTKGAGTTGGKSKKSSTTHAFNLLQAQQARRAAAEDAQRLANRLAQLRKEEQKSLKRIEETRRRAQQILDLRKRNEIVRIEKERLAHERATELAGLAQTLASVRDEHVVRKRKTVEALKQQKELSKREVMVQREKNDRMLKEQQIANRKAAVSSKETIRARQAELRAKKERNSELRLIEARQEFDKRVNEERKATSAKEKEIASMAKEEMMLIKTLQQKQKLQTEAYMELEQALGLLKEDKRGKSPSVSGSQRGGYSKKGAAAQKKAQQQAAAAAAAAQPEDPAADVSEAEIHSKFALFDPEATGEIDTNKLGPLLESLGQPVAPEQLGQVQAQLDRNGKVTVGELTLWWNS